jgi:hypothetical protein
VMTPDELDAIESLAITEHYAANVLSDGARDLAAALREAWAEVERLREPDLRIVYGYDLGVGDLEAVEARADQAEAAIARVRALCDEARVAISAGCWCDGEDDHEHTSRPLGWTLDPEQVRAALDGDT